MRKILLFIIISFTIYLQTNAINYSTSSSRTNSCDGANVDATFYVDGNSVTKFLGDMFWTSKEQFISTNSTNVVVWSSDSSLLTGCSSSADWKRISSLSPGNNQKVLALGANCTFNKPTNNNRRTLQFVYKVGYYDIISGGGVQQGNWNLAYYTSVSSMVNNTPIYKAYNNVGFDNLKIHPNECFNVELRYCGDGILETGRGETCDDGNNVNGDGCDSTCKTDVTPVCVSGGVTGVWTSPITSSTTNLCRSGETVGNFNSSVNGNTTTYTWSCNGNSGGNCSASYTTSTSSCVSGGVTGVWTSPITSSTTNLCRNGETVGNFNSSVNGNTTTYTWSCNGNSGGNCSASYTGGGGSESCISGGVTGSQSNPITSNTTNLCRNGETVGNFNSSVNGYTTTYSWSCNGNSGGNCSASYTGGGGSESCISGGVTGSQNSSINVNTPNLCRVGEAVGGFESHAIGSTTYYLWTCDGNSGGNCSASYSGGGGSSSCISGGVTGTQTSYISANTPNLCRSWETVGGFQSQTVGSTINYLWSCSGRSGGNCRANYTPGGGGGGGGSNYCGDGIVQRPNDNLEMEECDFGNEKDWKFCNRDCTYSNITIPGGGVSGEITIPNEGKIVFGPSDNVIIGESMNPYIAHGLGRPYIKNLSDYDLYFDQLCVVKTSGNTLLGSNECRNTGKILKSGETIYFPTTPDFVGGAINSGDYGDNIVVTTIKHKGIRYDDAYFTSKLKVRVAKSSIATTGGGTSYVSNTNSISNISNIANNGVLNPDENKNFIGVGVSTGSISSYSDNVNDSSLVGTVGGEGRNYSNNLDKVSNNTGLVVGTTSLISDFGKYNGISNVFIIRNKNFEINSNVLSGLSGPRTYIIENGDLIINSNIIYSDNVAFVVKGGNINIDKDVTRIDGTYITIEKNLIGGKFLGKGGKTLNKLVVNGSLYGDINNLIANRIYVKQNASNQVDVGTIVSFGSSLFRKNAPLIGTFINEYLTTQKIAK